ncbi:MAG: hypothetical protein AAB671_01270 [Patescibacteria group bacterium]
MAEKTLQGLLFAFVSDGAGCEAIVAPGDRVVLIPPEARKCDKDRPAWMRSWIGPEPYTIVRVCRNPNLGFIGKPLLIFRRPDGSEPGAFASEFQKAP